MNRKRALTPALSHAPSAGEGAEWRRARREDGSWSQFTSKILRCSLPLNMKAKDQFKSLARASLAAVFVLLGAAGPARAATPNIAGTGAAADIFDTANS